MASVSYIKSLSEKLSCLATNNFFIEHPIEKDLWQIHGSRRFIYVMNIPSVWGGWSCEQIYAQLKRKYYQVNVGLQRREELGAQKE